MKRMLIGMAFVFVFGFLKSSSAMGISLPIDELFGVIYPEMDFKYVQYLPYGHLHKNKPRYEKYDWRILESQHFRIYAYGDSKELDELYLTEAEKIYEEYSREFGMNTFSEKIRVIIYNSVRDFEETNLWPGLLPQGIGGWAELIKWRRVVIAFRDSTVGFRRLLRHELTHRFQAEILQLSMSGFAIKGSGVPLWFAEGDAERHAHSWEAYGEMIMRYCYLNNFLASVTNNQWPPALVYAQGEFVIRYLTEKYGKDAVGKILLETRKLGFKKAFQKVVGKNLKEFDEELKQHIEKCYSDLRTKTDIVDHTRTLDNGAVLLASRNNFFLTRKMVFGRNALFINWTDGQYVYSRKLVEDGRLKNSAIRGLPFETSPEFGFCEHGASFGSDTAVIYTIERNGRDEIRIQHFSFNKETLKFQLGKTEVYAPEEIRDIQYPVMVSEDEIAFVGRSGVFSEVFLFNRKTSELKKLTSAKRNYRGLTYSGSLHALVTSVENEETQSYDLAFGDLKTGEWHLLTETPENEFSQEFSSDGTRLLYVSDKDLVYNIYLYDVKAKLITPLTDAKIGVLRPKWFSDKGEEEGMLFIALDDNAISVQLGRLPTKCAASAEKPEHKPATEKSPDLKRFLEFLPDAESLTIIETVISPDKTKALFVINRRLSFETLGRKEPEIGFYLVDLTKKMVARFILGEFSKIEAFEHAEFLAGTNLLLQKSIKNDGDKTSSLVYDWEAKELYRLSTASSDIKIKFLGFRKAEDFGFTLRISPERRILVLIKDGKMMFYNVMLKEATYKKEFGKVLGAEFARNGKLLILSRSNGRDLTLYSLDLIKRTHSKHNLEFIENLASWHPLPSGTGVFFVSQSRSSAKYNVWLLQAEKGKTILTRSDLSVVKKAEIQDGTLVVETENIFGTKRILTINQEGGVAIEDELTPYKAQEPYSAVCSKTPLKEQVFKVRREIPRNIKKLSRFPKLYTGIGAGSLNLKGFVIAGSILALDDLNDRAYSINIYFQSPSRGGFADVGYYNFSTGRSYGLSYRGLNRDCRRFEIGASQNIFLDKFLNWDITVKEQHVKMSRSEIHIREWWQTKLGTTFSLDTVTGDWHGSHSGNAVFSGAEVGVSPLMEFRCLDINLDARCHLPLTDRSGLAFRFAGGYSFGPDPTVFAWGGNQTFRGIPLFSQSGNNYVMQSSEIRFPILDIIGAQTSGFSPGTRIVMGSKDIRGGIYNDIGDIWYNGEPTFGDGHKGFRMQYSTGLFVNIPILFGGQPINIRFNKGFYGKKGMNLWVGYNW